LPIYVANPIVKINSNNKFHKITYNIKYLQYSLVGIPDLALKINNSWSYAKVFPVYNSDTPFTGYLRAELFYPFKG
jgi:hypothetical protein